MAKKVKAKKPAAKPAGKKVVVKPAKPAKPAVRPAHEFHSANAKKADTALLDALLKATGEKGPAKDETLKDFCYRLFVKMVEVPDDVFKALPKEARDWYDASSDAYNAERFDAIVALPGMPGVKAVAAPAVAAPEAQQEADAPPAGKFAAVEHPETNQETDVAKAKKGGAKPAGKTKEAKANGERKPRTDGTAYQVRQAVVKNPAITFEKVAAAIGLKGKAATEGSHAHNYYNHARVVIAMFKGHAGIK